MLNKDRVENYVRKLRMIKNGEITEAMARFDKYSLEYTEALKIHEARKQDYIYDFFRKFCK